MDEARVKAAIDARMAIYRKKQARHDPFEDDSMTNWEGFQRCLEAMEWLASDLGIGVALPTDDYGHHLCRLSPPNSLAIQP